MVPLLARLLVSIVSLSLFLSVPPSGHAIDPTATTHLSASTHATSPLIAADPVARRIFACARDVTDDPGDHLAVADESTGMPIATLHIGCSGIVVNQCTHHLLVDDGAGALTVINAVTLRVLDHVKIPTGTLVGALPFGQRLILAFSNSEWPDAAYAPTYTDYPGQEAAPGLNGTARPPGGTGSIVVLDACTERISAEPSLDPGHEDVLTTDVTTGCIVLEAQHGGVDVVDIGTRAVTHVELPTSQVYALAAMTDGHAGHLLVGYIESEREDSSGEVTAPVIIDVYDLAHGQRLHSFQISTDPDTSSFSMDVDPQRDRVAVVNYYSDMHVDVLDIRTGRTIHEFNTPIDGQPVLAVDSVTGRIYIATLPAPDRDQQYPTTPGSFFALDGNTGKILSHASIGFNPHAVLIDDMTGRAFTADEGAVTMIDGRAYPGQFGASLPSDPASSSAAHGPNVYYAARTHHTLSGLFLAFWRRYGGSSILGNPMTQPFSDGSHTVQYTERFELALDHGTVRTEPIGTELRWFEPAPIVASEPTRRYFPSTHHSLSGRFLTFWQEHDGPRLLGAPISEPIVEGDNDGSGRRYLTQWFENGSLEYHPENTGTSGIVRPGPVGVRAVRVKGWLPYVTPLSE